MAKLLHISSLQFNRNRVILFAVNALIGLPNGYAQVILPIYFKMIGISPVLVGVLTTVSLLTASILLVPFGILSDRHGRKPFLVLGGLLTAISWAMMAVTTDFTLIAISRAISGVGNALMSAPFNAALADVSSDQDRTKAFSISSFVSQIASTGGALISGMPEALQAGFGFSLISSYKPMFLLACLITLAAMGFMFPFKEERSKEREFAKARFRSMKKILIFAVTRGLIGFGAGFVIPLFSLWFYLRFGIGGPVLGPLFAISNMTLAFSYLISSRLAGTIGSVNSLVLCQALAIIMLVAIPESPDYTIVAVLYVARNFLMNMSSPIETSFLMGIVKPEERASASAVAGTASNIARAVSPSFGGYFMSNISLSVPFYITAALYASSTAIFYSVFRNVRVSGETSRGLGLRR
jgi:MFS family permease